MAAAAELSFSLLFPVIGSAVWTPMEKELFHKAFCVYKRNFSLIQKMPRGVPGQRGETFQESFQEVPSPTARGRVGQCPKPAAVFFHQVRTKTVAQCVQYYYGWKKRVTFTTSSWAPALEKRVKRKLAEADPTETKATCSPQKRRHHHPTLELKTETESGRGESVITASPSAAPKRTPEPPGRVQGQGAFPCGECERVFDKMWTRYAHMKRHRLQDPEETAVGEERPAKAFKVSEDEAGRASWEIRQPLEGDDGQRSHGHLST
ncbi:zinc finger protein 541-like [Manis pentadactyla]|uniref:zinc finger protein 541-like n=1 Tax=Manis pentadactyla TaxID=143292 RepID=UPI00255CE792|nr:zinc finger protein 541-like [Manis pentadactyla]XP_057352729.1 zinc finger protein 541-like [Manis pentadactyla]